MNLSMGVNLQSAKDFPLSHEQLISLVEHLPYATGVFGRDLTYLYFNPAGEKMSGISLGEAIGKKPTDLLPPEACQVFVPLVEEVIRTGKPIQKEVKIGFGEHMVWLALNYVPLQDSSQVTCVLGITQDITQQKFVDKQRRLAEQVAQTGSWHWRPEANQLWLSEESSRLLQLPTPSDPSMDLLLNHLSPSSRDHVLAALQEAKTAGKGFDIEVEVLGSNSNPRYIRIWGETESLANRVTAVAGAMQDVTTKKQEEIKLQVAVNAARRADRVKTEFLQNVSHEIRTPLNAIAGFSELMCEPDIAQDMMTDMQNRIRSNVKVLLRVIDSIIHMSQMSGTDEDVQRENVTLGQIIHDLKAFAAPKAQAKGLELSFRCDVGEDQLVYTDLGRTLQIAQNLIENAIKFTDKGFVKVTFEIVQKGSEAAHLVIRVEDSGVGIPMDRHSELFQPFHQLDSTSTRQHGGLGIGLALAKTYAEQLDGALHLQCSLPGRGSIFEAIIGRVQSGAPAAANPIAMEGNGSGPRKDKGSTLAGIDNPLEGSLMLLIEDNTDNQAYFCKVLASAGALVDIAADGRKGLEMARTGQYDMIIVDVNLPLLDGVEVTHILRAEGCAVPIVAITGLATKDDRERCMKAGCNAFLTKPVRKVDLLECLEFYIA